MGKRLRTARPLPRVEGAQISFTGMRDSLDPTTASDRKAIELRNVYPQDPEMGGALVGRPGFAALNTSAIAGTPSIRHIAQFVKNDGTVVTVLFAGTKMYEVNLGTGALVDKTSTMTIDGSAEIYTVGYADGIVVSDGVNEPWHWDGVSTYTDLATGTLGAGFKAYGQPVVYYAKLFFINADDRTEIVWSEENSLLTGFTTGGYNNGWNLIQTQQTPLYALAATEQALYYFRENSIGAVIGEVTTNFASTGVQDAVSATVGCKSPGTVVVVDRDIFFLDQNNLPRHFPVGGTLTQNFEDDARETAKTIDHTNEERHRAVYWPHAHLVLFGVGSQPGSTYMDQIMAYSREQREFVGLWSGFNFHALALIYQTDGISRLVHGSPTDGFMYQHGTPDGSIWSDQFDGGTVGINHVVDGTAIGYSLKYQGVWSRIDMVLRGATNMSGVLLQLRSPNGTQELTLADLESGGAVWGTAVWGTSLWSTVGELDLHVAAHFNLPGRWVRARLEHSTVDEQFGFMGWQALGVRTSQRPEIR